MTTNHKNNTKQNRKNNPRGYKNPEKKPAAQMLAEAVAERWSIDFKTGQLPWHKPWAVLFGTTISHLTGKPYSLRNQMLLEYDRSENAPGEYVTFKQCKQENGNIRKGEKSSIVLFSGEFTPKQPENEQPENDETDDADEPETIHFLKGYPVFKIDQCDGIKPKWNWEPPTLNINADERSPELESIVADFCRRYNVTIKHGQQKAWMEPAGVAFTVFMPNWEHFKSGRLYYKTLFHEFSHVADFGNFKSYGHNKQVRGIAEAVADFSSCLVMKYIGTETPEILEETNAYINGWLEAVNDSPRLVWKIITRAERAALAILNLDVNKLEIPEREPEQEKQPEPEPMPEQVKQPAPRPLPVVVHTVPTITAAQETPRPLRAILLDDDDDDDADLVTCQLVGLNL